MEIFGIKSSVPSKGGKEVGLVCGWGNGEAALDMKFEGKIVGRRGLREVYVLARPVILVGGEGNEDGVYLVEGLGALRDFWSVRVVIEGKKALSPLEQRRHSMIAIAAVMSSMYQKARGCFRSVVLRRSANRRYKIPGLEK